MNRFARYTVRFLAIVALAALAPMLLTGAGAGRGPYVSALSNLTAADAYAASHPHCFRTCTTKGTCTTGSLPTVCLTSNGVCSTGTCR